MTMENQQTNQDNSQFASSPSINIYEPKIRRGYFYFYLFLFDVISPFIFGIIFTSVHVNRGGFDGLPQFFIFIFLEIIFTILAIISYEILVKKEKDGSKYSPLNHNIKYNIILIISIIIFLISLISAITYLIPLIKNYGTFSSLELLKNSKYTYWGYLPEMYINNFLSENYLVLRCIFVILSGHLIYLTIKKLNVARVYLLWLISFMILSQLFLGLDLLGTTYTIRMKRIQNVVDMTNGILEYDKVIISNNPQSCNSIKNARAQFNCKNYFFQVEKNK